MERRQILLGRRGHYLQGDGEVNALFSGIKRAQTPPWGLIFGFCPLLYFYIGKIKQIFLSKTIMPSTLIFDMQHDRVRLYQGHRDY